VSERQHEHEPVLLEPLLGLLDPRPGQLILDGTVGLGGHAAALLPRILPGGRYLGLDLDETMLDGAREHLAAGGGEGLYLVKANYADFPGELSRIGAEQVDHMLLDLGVNSAQLQNGARGFSFERDGPLDMRYDRSQKKAAVDLVNALSERDLADLFYRFGQEGLSRKIAKQICRARHGGRITTTRGLVAAVQGARGPGRAPRGGRIHPATRVFQALRVAVNRELENLEAFLEQVVPHLRPGGKLAVISFHSLEDGMVKRFLRRAKAGGTMEELTRRPVVADAEERKRNRRSRSAKLRVGRRLEAGP
jgi:16S rRNA (cytosine1402-N4)-methyltransferase